MKKKLFIISNNQKIWDLESSNIFISDPYVYHVLEKDEKLGQYQNIEVAPYRRQSKNDLLKDAAFVDKKYKQYLPILTKRLNEIHSRNYDERYWSKSLSLAFIRYITIFHNIYEILESYFDPAIHYCNILSRSSYYIPEDFEDHRRCFQYTDFGPEQIASIYFGVHHKGISFNEKSDTFVDDTCHEGVYKRENLVEGNTRSLLGRVGNVKPRRFCKALLSYLKKVCSGICEPPGEREHGDSSLAKVKIAICGCLFSAENRDRLIQLSGGKIQLVDWYIEENEKEDFHREERKRISQFEEGFDRFDKFFFKSLEFCLPKAFLENYSHIEAEYSLILNKYKSLDSIVSEIWISNTYLSIFLALARWKGVKHIACEHNSLTHPYAGSFVTHLAKLTDTFISMGWFSDKVPNMLRGASLFPFKGGERGGEGEGEIHEILYISGPAATKIPHYLSHYATDEEGVPKSVKFIKQFFGALPISFIEKITYRRYPVEFYGIKYLSYDREYLLKSCLEHVKEFADVKEPGKKQMLESKLIIIDYLSTSHLEALHMNKPVIFFHNPNAYFLNDEYLDLFDDLIEVGVCQNDPIQAAAFVQKVASEPGRWWYSDEVQSARMTFLERNFGESEQLIKYIVDLASKE